MPTCGTSRVVASGSPQATCSSGRARGRYLDLVCNDGSGYAALDVIGGDLGERLARGKEGPADSVAKVLAKWRPFWGPLPPEALSREAQLRLFAEVWFLTFWLVPTGPP